VNLSRPQTERTNIEGENWAAKWAQRGEHSYQKLGDKMKGEKKSDTFCFFADLFEILSMSLISSNLLS